MVSQSRSDGDAEKKAEWIIKSMLRYDIEIHKVPIDEEDVGEMGNQEFKKRLFSARKIEDDTYFFQKHWRIFK